MTLDVWCLWHQSLSSNVDLRLAVFSALIREGLSPRTHASQLGRGRHSCHCCAGYSYSWVAPRARANCTPSRRIHSKLLDRCITRGDSLLFRQRQGNSAGSESHLGVNPCSSGVDGKPAADCVPDNCREQPFAPPTRTTGDTPFFEETPSPLGRAAPCSLRCATPDSPELLVVYRRRADRIGRRGGGLRAHVMLRHNHYDLMPFTTPGQGPLRYRQDSRKVSPGHENVAVIKEGAQQPRYAVNLYTMPRTSGQVNNSIGRRLRPASAPPHPLKELFHEVSMPQIFLLLPLIRVLPIRQAWGAIWTALAVTFIKRGVRRI